MLNIHFNRLIVSFMVLLSLCVFIVIRTISLLFVAFLGYQPVCSYQRFYKGEMDNGDKENLLLPLSSFHFALVPEQHSSCQGTCPIIYFILFYFILFYFIILFLFSITASYILSLYLF
jgi:hypothetical protein